MLTWSAFRLDESRADGAFFSFLVLGFVLLTLVSQRRVRVLPSSWLLLLALGCGLWPLLQLAQQGSGWAPSLAGLADRAPLVCAWILAGAVSTGSPFSLARLAQPLLIGGALAALLGIIQALGWDPPGYDSLLSIRPVYPFAGPSHATEVQLPLLLLGLVALPSMPRPRLWLWLALAPIALQLGYLGSNAGRIALLASVFWLGWKQQRTLWPPLGATLAILLVGEIGRSLLGGVEIPPPPPTPVGFETDSTQNPSGNEAQNTHRGIEANAQNTPRGMRVRKLLYLAGLGHFFRHPLGIGIGRFESDYPGWRPAEEARLSSGNWKDTSNRIPKTPHQDYLLAGLELGWAGSLLLVAALWRLWTARQKLQIPASSLRPSTTPLWIALLALALFRSPFSDNPSTLAFAALLLGWDMAGAPHPTTAPSRPWPTLLAVLGVLLCLPPAWAQARGEHFADLAVRDPEHLAEHLEDAVRSRPWDNRSLVLLGSYHLANQNWNGARDCFDRTLIYHPTDLAALTAYIKVEMIAPDGDETFMLRLLARAEQFAPFHPSVKQARVLWLQGYHKVFQDEAVRRVQQGIPNAGPWLAASYLAEAYIAAVENRPDATRKALFQAAAVAPQGYKGLLERTAAQAELEPNTLAKLTQRVFPNWPRLAY